MGQLSLHSPSWHFEILKAFRVWGVWPAVVMVLAQLEVARLKGEVYPLALAALTLAGTMAVYGADRFLERRILAELGDRHEAHGTLPFCLVIVVLGLVALPALRSAWWSWLAELGCLGGLYLAITVNKLPAPPLSKELLGSAIFTWLVWGPWPGQSSSLEAGFFAMGFANFLSESHADRVRDRANGLHSLAVLRPRINLALAKLAAVLALFWFATAAGWSPIFFAVALGHAVWPGKPSIDWAFLPLVFTFCQVF